MFNIICDAIAERLRLEFDYGGLHRIVEPYCHGISSAGHQTLRAIQVGGESKSPAVKSGKLWTVTKMSNLRLGEKFTAGAPDYQPDDSALPTIHCRI